MDSLNFDFSLEKVYLLMRILLSRSKSELFNLKLMIRVIILSLKLFMSF